MPSADVSDVCMTHQVENQPPPLLDYDAFGADAALVEGVKREGGGWAIERLTEFGRRTTSQQFIELGFQANRNRPVLRTHDRFGHRIDEVEFHPSWHELMRIGVEAEAHALPWNHRQPGANVARAALNYLFFPIESGVGCPLTMTFAGVPVLAKEGTFGEQWVKRLTSTEYDGRNLPVDQKSGALLGMAMTEKQGGSDVRANSTTARPIGKGGRGEEYLLTGHKWFCSAPMCDAFLTLAQTESGLSCFLFPRWLPDGTRNRFFLQRLKDKLGNHSNASSEIEYHDTWAVMVGDEGRGVPTIIEMVQHTRLDCVAGSAGLMRHALAQAIHHTAHRKAFGKLLIDQPAMQNVLADLAIETEAATTLMLRLARAFDSTDDRYEQAFARIATAVSKYWVCKRTPQHVAEALECLGGAGYVEESIMPRLYREAPLNSIWEGSGNVMCLDVLRAMSREPESLAAFDSELQKASGVDKRMDTLVSQIQKGLQDQYGIQFRARRLVEQMALALQGSLLLQHGDSHVAEAFCASRLAGDHGHVFGTLSPDVQFTRIIERSHPQIA
ncbi:MAG: isovaleryl-CoA dehydrogenase [Planctomycetaceae bacterium]|nr:isovaleryl-CoA dehydrogenase [Planctomycetaceae bacterium]